MQKILKEHLNKKARKLKLDQWLDQGYNQAKWYGKRRKDNKVKCLVVVITKP